MANLHVSISPAISLYVLSFLFFLPNSRRHLSSCLPLANSLSLSAQQLNKDVHDLLPHYGLPRGLLPDNVRSYTLDPSGSFSVQLTNPCYVHFDQFVYFDKEIKGKLSYGVVREVSGIQAKKFFLWVSISGIEVSKDGDGMIEFFVGTLSEKLPVKQFEDVPVCKSKAADNMASL